MDYSEPERKLLNTLNRTDFRHIKKDDLLRISSQIQKMRPEVAAQAIAQFPELAGVIKVSMAECQDMLHDVVESDDNSINQLYSILNKEIDKANESRDSYYNMLNNVQADLNKRLDNPDVSAEQQQAILNMKIDLLKMADRKDSEIRNQEKEILKMAYEKDSEKRDFNWRLMGAFAATAIIAASTCAAALGVKIKVPHRS